jgi:hypothetical protein
VRAEAVAGEHAAAAMATDLGGGHAG